MISDHLTSSQSCAGNSLVLELLREGASKAPGRLIGGSAQLTQYAVLYEVRPGRWNKCESHLTTTVVFCESWFAGMKASAMAICKTAQVYFGDLSAALGDGFVHLPSILFAIINSGLLCRCQRPRPCYRQRQLAAALSFPVDLPV